MNRFRRLILAGLLGATLPTCAATNAVPVEQQRWFETRTAHFNIFSSGDSQEVYRLAGRLEQFCNAYAQLAGAQALDSPPIVVLAFPDAAAMQPYLPLYQGKPSNMAAFFKRGTDENLIVLSLPETGSAFVGMEIIFHEYTHLLFRRNDQFWPLWLEEGMAEVYSTFQTSGYGVRIASPIPYHLKTLRHEGFMPLKELMTITNGSPQYNETQRQGMFYAEAWLLTHFLMAGDGGKFRPQLAEFNRLLRQGQTAEPAFTNALQASLPVVELALKRYLAKGVFSPIDLTLATEVSTPINVISRYLTPVEVDFRLGDELLRVDQGAAAEGLFDRAKKLAPLSPLPEEGLGLLANMRQEHAAARQHFRTAIQLGSTSYLAYYLYALEEFNATADAAGKYQRIDKNLAAAIRNKLTQSIAQMPRFGPAEQVLGVLELVQGNLAVAGQHLQRAMALEPENPAYQLTLAQYQFLTKNLGAARQTLAPLLRPNADPKFRADAEKLLRKIEAR